MTDRAEGRDLPPTEAAADAVRPQPAPGPVIESVPLSTAPEAAGAADASHPMIDSVLVGGGEGQAAAPREALRHPAAPDAAEGGPAASGGIGEAEVVAREAPLAASSVPPVDREIRADAAPSVSLAPARRSGGFWPLAFGGVVAAALGAGAVWFVDHRLPAGPDPALGEAARAAVGAELDARAAALAETAREAGAAAGNEAGNEAGAEAARAVLAGLPPQAGAAAAGQAALDAQAARIDALEARLAEAGTAPAAEGTGPAAPATDALDALRRELAAQAGRIDELAARPAADPALAEELRAMAEGAAAARERAEAAAAQVEARLAEAARQSESIQAEVEQNARRAETAAAVARLEGVLDSGGDTAAAMAGLRAAGVEPPAALAAEIPSLDALQDGFDDAARAGLRAAQQAAPEGGGGGLLGFIREQTGARSVTPRSGSDPDAVLSRAGAAVAEGDIAAALAEIDGLPPAARDAMSGWIAGARAWTDARAALGSLKPQP